MEQYERHKSKHRDRSKERRGRSREKRDKSREKRDKSRDRRDRSRERRDKSKERRDKKKRDEKKRQEKIREFEKKFNQALENRVTHQEEEDVEQFMFVYEDDEGKLYTELTKLPPVNDKIAKIFPIFFTGGNENLTEEFIKYTEAKWLSESEEQENSWLNIINSTDEKVKVLLYEGEDIVVYNDKFFHCEKDLLDYLEFYGAEVLPVCP